MHTDSAVHGFSRHHRNPGFVLDPNAEGKDAAADEHHREACWIRNRVDAAEQLAGEIRQVAEQNRYGGLDDDFQRFAASLEQDDLDGDLYKAKKVQPPAEGQRVVNQGD